MLKLLVLCVLVLRSCLAQVMPQAVSCLVYPPGQAWSTLPTTVSLQPKASTTNWSAKLQLTDQTNDTVGCLGLESEGDQVKVDLYTQHCGDSHSHQTSAFWSLDHFNPDSWIDFKLNIVQDELQLSFLQQNSQQKNIITTTVNFSASLLMVHTEPQDASVSYNCQNGCRFFSLMNSQEPVQLEALRESTTINIFPHPEFRNIQFHTTTTETQASPLINTLDLSNLTLEHWHEVQVEIQAEEYRVLVDQKQVLEDNKSFTRYKFDKMDVFLEGAAYWSTKCRPQNPSLDDTSATTEMFPTNFRHVLHADVMLTLVALVGCVVDLVLVVRRGGI